MFLILRTPIVWYNLGVMIQPYIAIAVAFGIAGLLALPGAMGLKLRMIRLKSAELVLFLAMAAIGVECRCHNGGPFREGVFRPEQERGL